MAQCYRCDQCGRIDDTVVVAREVVAITSQGLALHHRGYFEKNEVGDAAVIVRMPIRTAVGAYINHICWSCVREAIKKYFNNITQLLVPFHSSSLLPELGAEYVSKGRMLTEQQVKALEVLKPLLLLGGK